MMARSTQLVGITNEAADETQGLGVVEGVLVVATSRACHSSAIQKAPIAWQETTMVMIMQHKRHRACALGAARLHTSRSNAHLPRFLATTQNTSLEIEEIEEENL